MDVEQASRATPKETLGHFASDELVQALGGLSEAKAEAVMAYQLQALDDVRGNISYDTPFFYYNFLYHKKKLIHLFFYSIIQTIFDVLN